MYLKEPFLDLMKYSLFSMILIIFYCFKFSSKPCFLQMKLTVAFLTYKYAKILLGPNEKISVLVS